MDGLWAAKREGVGLIVGAISFQDFQPVNESTNVTDRRTDGRAGGRIDGRTTCNRNTALSTIVHRAVKIVRNRWRSSIENKIGFTTFFLGRGDIFFNSADSVLFKRSRIRMLRHTDLLADMSARLFRLSNLPPTSRTKTDLGLDF